jgi:hypothetical protein
MPDLVLRECATEGRPEASLALYRAVLMGGLLWEPALE